MQENTYKASLNNKNIRKKVMKNKKNTFSLFLALALIIGVGLTSAWKADINKVDVNPIKESESIINDSSSKMDNPLDIQDIEIFEEKLEIDYKDGYPDLASCIKFEDAFAKARMMNVENFWFNKNLYHTQLREDVPLETPSNSSENLDANITDQDIQNNLIID